MIKDITNKKLEIALKWIIPMLEKHQISFRLTGGLAAHIYGVDRPIQDIDFDVPDDQMEKLIPEIKPYIIFGPAEYKDESWSLKLITLNYKGQEIDLCGSSKAKIFNQSTKLWEDYQANFETSSVRKFCEIKIPVIDLKALIDYKTKLAREVDLIDIKSLKK